MPETKVIKVDPHFPAENAIRFAAALLQDGGLVAFPTETVYGIGANFLNKRAIDRLYKVKKRPRDKPFTIHISSINTIKKMQCEIPPLASALIKEFWPGPLTIILTCQVAPVRSHLTGRKVGFRMPRNTVAKELISKSGVPLAVPSANISGKKPPTKADEVLDVLNGKIDLILDGGKTEFGKESTVVDTTVSPYKILREGAITKDEIERIAYSV